MTYFVYTPLGSEPPCADCQRAKTLLREAGETLVVVAVSKEVLRTLVPEGVPARFPRVSHTSRGWIGGLAELEEVLTEPLLRPSSSEHDDDDEVSDFYVFDSSMTWATELYDRAQASFWITKEIRLHDDVTHWREMAVETREWLKHILAFFAAADGVVAESVADRYGQLNDASCRAFLGYQLYNEQVHAQTYATILKTLVSSSAEREEVLRAAQTAPHIREKTRWSLKWIGRGNGRLFAEKTVAYACVELIFFSSSFCALFWVRRTGKLPGVCLSNEFIARDEGMHGDFACMLYRSLARPLPETRVLEVVREAVALEQRFVRESLRVDLIGMRADLLCDHVEFMGDRVLQQLGYSKHYHTETPYAELLERQSMSGHTNFFERTVSEYSRGTLAEEDEFGDVADLL